MEYHKFKLFSSPIVESKSVGFVRKLASTQLKSSLTVLLVGLDSFVFAEATAIPGGGVLVLVVRLLVLLDPRSGSSEQSLLVVAIWTGDSLQLA